MRMRRRLLVFIIQLLKPALSTYRLAFGPTQISVGHIRHLDEHPLNDYRHDDRGVSQRSKQLIAANPSENYGFQLRLRRLELGLTQTDLAELVGIQKTHLCEIELGYHRPHSKTENKIQRTLNDLTKKLFSLPFKGQNLDFNLRPSVLPSIRQNAVRLLAGKKQNFGNAEIQRGGNELGAKVTKRKDRNDWVMNCLAEARKRSTGRVSEDGKRYISPFFNRTSAVDTRLRQYKTRKNPRFGSPLQLEFRDPG